MPQQHQCRLHSQLRWCWEVGLLLPLRVTLFAVTARSKRGRGGVGADGDKANYFHLSAAPCQQTCNLKRSQWSLGRLWALGEYGFTDEAFTGNSLHSAAGFSDASHLSPIRVLQLTFSKSSFPENQKTSFMVLYQKIVMSSLLVLFFKHKCAVACIKKSDQGGISVLQQRMAWSSEGCCYIKGSGDADWHKAGLLIESPRVRTINKRQKAGRTKNS